MSFKFKKLCRQLALGASVAALLPTVASAQDAPPSDGAVDDQVAETAEATGAEDKAIVVTGTLIRGIAPAGNNVIGITEDQIEATGGTSTNQILNSLPQVGNFFNALPAGVSGVSGANTSNPISRPNLRNLPAANTSGGAQTLVLLDGHRVIGAGIQQVAVDPDILAPGVIARVEALTDGGSAVYGSDALGGVLNLITRRKFDGIEFGARYGFGDDYYIVDGNAKVGKDWGSGGIYVAYGYTHHDAIFGLDRDFVRQIDWNTMVPTGRNCADPTATVGAGAAARTYVASGSGITAGGPVTCDLSDNQAIYPVNTLHTGFSRFTQDLNDSIRIDISALYANRKIRGVGGALGTGALGSGAAGQATLCPLTSTATGCIRSANYRDPGGTQAGLPETVRFNYAPLFGARSATQQTDLETFSIAPELSFELGGGFQLRTLASYGWAKTSFRNAQVSSLAQSAALNSGALNPFSVGTTSPTVAATLRQFDGGYGRNELWDYRAIVDGPLFEIGGGEVRVALGAEHMRDHFQLRTTNTAVNPFVLRTPQNYIQKVNSVFGEVQVPLFGDDNATTGIHELTLSASARYDDYSDFGNTFNPKAGLTWRPVEWFTIRGNAGKSFNAPTPVDQLRIAASTVAPVPAQFLTIQSLNLAPLVPPQAEVGVFVAGTAPGIGPQKAKSYSIGAEIEPPFAPGLKLSASYYYIDLKGVIGRPVTGADLTPFLAGFPDLFTVRPSGQALAAYLTQFDPANISFTLTNPTATTQAIINSGGNLFPVVVTLDTRARNLGATKLSGIDFEASYEMETGFGSIDARVAGNHKLKQRSQATPTAIVTNDLFVGSIPRTLFQVALGATVRNFRAQATLNHTSGYRRGDAFVLNALGKPTATPVAAAFGQTKVKAFDALNLFFRYDVPESLLGPDLQLTLNVQNALDDDPPLFRSATSPGYNTTGGQAFTIGRVVQFGFNKKF